MKNCIEWTGRKNKNGYGVVMIDGKQYFAHRLAVAMSGRNIPKSKVCDHLCRNHGCVNPKHIELVTPYENWWRGRNADKHRSPTCAKGHLLEGENLRIQKRAHGGIDRQCRRCYADRMYKYRRAKGVPTMPKRYKYE